VTTGAPAFVALIGCYYTRYHVAKKRISIYKWYDGNDLDDALDKLEGIE